MVAARLISDDMGNRRIEIADPVGIVFAAPGGSRSLNATSTRFARAGAAFRRSSGFSSARRTIAAVEDFMG